MKILLLDNYDSFTYNLKAQIERCVPFAEVSVKRNRDNSAFGLDFDLLVVSPGPMTWKETGVLKELFEERVVPEKKPYLGICLGMQFLAGFYGFEVGRISDPVHGSAVEISHTCTGLFEGVSENFYAARYNSLGITDACRDETERNGLMLTSFEKGTGAVMSVEHKELPFAGFQFHTESFLTPEGDRLIINFRKKYLEN